MNKENNVLNFRSPKVNRPVDCIPWLSDIKAKDYENFTYLCLDSERTIISKKILFTGNEYNCKIISRDLWRNILDCKSCVAVIFSHNHPEGTLTPSKDDDITTKTLVDAGKVLGIDVLDHIIVSKNGYYSYLEYGKI